jgi:bacterioferritin-associated ferredoxin
VFACICRAVTRDQVSTAIDNGAATVEAVSRATRACTGCGTCRERIEGMLGERAAHCPVKALQSA